jgi:hypothetical protein
MHTTRILTALAATAALVATTAGPATAKDGDIVVAGKCSAGANSKLKVGPRDGRFEVEFEVDENANGRVWDVSLSDNGVSVFKGAARTAAPSGSFEVRRVIANRAGRDTIRATAKSRTTGQTCSATVAI